MAQEGEIHLIDVTARQTVQLMEYDCIGFASGIYGFEFQKAVVEFARQYLPAGKPVFFIYTYGGVKGTGSKAVAEIANAKGCSILGEFSCKGYDTFAPFKWWAARQVILITQDLDNAADFSGRSRKVWKKNNKSGKKLNPAWDFLQSNFKRTPQHLVYWDAADCKKPISREK